MAKGYSKELIGVRDGTVVPPKKADATYYHSRMRTIRAVFDLSQATVAKVSGDTNVIGVIPRGNRFTGVTMDTDTSLATSTVAIGNAADAAAYKAAAVFTATDTPTSYGKAVAKAADAVTADTEVFFTIGTANLPASGILVIDLHYAGR